MAFNIHVKVRPVVLFQICDAYERRNIENHRVIGTLLGKKLQASFQFLFGFLKYFLQVLLINKALR